MTSEQETAEQTQLTAFASRTAPCHRHTKQTATPASSPSAGSPTQEAAERYERGLALKKIGSYKEALEQFSLAAKDAGFTFKAMAQVGICLKSSGQSEQAVTAFRKALQASRLIGGRHSSAVLAWANARKFGPR